MIRGPFGSTFVWDNANSSMASFSMVSGEISVSSVNVSCTKIIYVGVEKRLNDFIIQC